MAATDHVDLDIPADKITGIIGPNGAGKTTLVHLLTGHLLPDSGSITLEGQEITDLPAHERVAQGLCRTFQVVDVFNRLTVFQNVQIACITRQRRNLRFLRSEERRVGTECRQEW